MRGSCAPEERLRTRNVCVCEPRADSCGGAARGVVHLSLLELSDDLYKVTIVTGCDWQVT